MGYIGRITKFPLKKKGANMEDIRELADNLSDEDFAEILRIKAEHHKELYLSYQKMHDELTGARPQATRRKQAASAPKKRRGRKPAKQRESESAGKPTKARKAGRPAGSRNRKKSATDSEA